MKITHIVPKPIREKLYPYKEKLLEKYGKKMVDKAMTKQVIENCDSPLLREMCAFSQKYGMDYIKAKLELGWEKPGEMFDELGRIFEKNNKLFLVGESADVERVSAKLCFLDTQISTLAMPAQQLLNDVQELNRISMAANDGYTFVIAYQKPGEPEAVATALLERGRQFLNVNLFYEINFIGVVPCSGDYCGIFSVYTAEKVYLKHQNMLVTTACNLRCEYCLNYNPYNRKQKHFDFEELKRCADIYFSHIDRVGFFELTGGEPMLYPHLQEIIEYISSRYGKKIDEFTFVTNGSVVPTDEFCEFLKERNVTVIIDDYTMAVPKTAETLTQAREKLNKIGTNAIVYPPVREFLKSFPPAKGNLELREKDLQEKYRKCMIGVQNLRDGKLCSCTYHAFAVNAGLVENNSDDWFDMSQMSDCIKDKKTLIEFRSGFSKKGYTDWCRYCNGVQTINTHYAPAAEQVKGFLDWDINNPTFLDE